MLPGTEAHLAVSADDAGPCFSGSASVSVSAGTTVPAADHSADMADGRNDAVDGSGAAHHPLLPLAAGGRADSACVNEKWRGAAGAHSGSFSL